MVSNVHVQTESHSYGERIDDVPLQWSSTSRLINFSSHPFTDGQFYPIPFQLFQSRHQSQIAIRGKKNNRKKRSVNVVFFIIDAN